MKKLFLLILAAIMSIVTAAQQIESSGPQPEYMPYCQSPQQISPLTEVATLSNWTGPFVAWNGKEYAVVFSDIDTNGHKRVYFRRFYADGTPASSLIPVTVAGSDFRVRGMVFNGSGYGLVYQYAPGGIYEQAYFLGLDMNGAIVAGPVKASFAGGAETSSAMQPHITFGSGNYCITWEDDRAGNYDVYATLLNSDGSIAGSGTFHDILVCGNSASVDTPRCEWSSLGGGGFRITWTDSRAGVQVYSAWLSIEGMVCCETLLVGAGSMDPRNADIAFSPGGMALVWEDLRSGNKDIYFARYDADGNKIGSDNAVTTHSWDSYNPVIVWTGSEYGVFWQDNRNGNYDIWFQRVGANGVLSGSNTQLSFTNGMVNPSAAFAGKGYMIAGESGYVPYVESVGCNYENTPPSCPTNLLAYNISGTQATISWGPSGDNETDMAYYIVFRNNSEIAKTSGTYYTDTGLALNTTYNYMVQPVNAAQLQNYACGTSIYTKTNASFTLMLDKSCEPSAHLYWNDGGMNNYNIFRGTSPQVMSLIGSTSGQFADDANVLLDRNNYFYTVDDPGQ